MHDTKQQRHNQQDPCLFAKCLYKANDMPEFFRLYSDELMKLSEEDTNALLEAGFVRSYASQIYNPHFLKSSKEEYVRLQKFVTDLDHLLHANVEGRCKSATSAIDKAKKYIDKLDIIHDIYAFRVVVYGPFTEQQQISYCYKLLNRIVRYYLSQGFILCKATAPSNLLDKNSEAYKKLVLPTDEDLKLISWIPGDRYKDYILSPKANLYRSLHLALRGPKGFTFEIQIRTLLMDVISKEGDSNEDEGNLSHKNYKKNKYPDGVIFDRSKVHFPGYIVTTNPETGEDMVYDTIGLETARQIISGANI